MASSPPVPPSMLAAVYPRYGPPDVVEIDEVPVPTPGRRQVLVRVGASTVNRTDCGYRAGHPLVIRAMSGLTRPRHLVLGTEFAGEVVALGPGASRFAVGDRLFGYVEGRFGAHAQYLAVEEEGSVAATPAALSDSEVAPATEGAHYALSSLQAAGVGAGDAVLVNGATGAIGSAAVQLLARLGADVVAVCDRDNADLVAGLGARRTIDYTAVDVTTDGQRFDVVFDAVGTLPISQGHRLLLPGGRYCATDTGPFGVNLIASAVSPITSRLGRLHPSDARWLGWSGHRAMMPLPHHDRAMVEHLADLLDRGAFRPVVDRIYQLDQIIDAHHHADSGTKIGNLVLEMPRSTI